MDATGEHIHGKYFIGFHFTVARDQKFLCLTTCLTCCMWVQVPVIAYLLSPLLKSSLRNHGNPVYLPGSVLEKDCSVMEPDDVSDFFHLTTCLQNLNFRCKKTKVSHYIQTWSSLHNMQHITVHLWWQTISWKLNVAWMKWELSKCSHEGHGLKYKHHPSVCTGEVQICIKVARQRFGFMTLQPLLVVNKLWKCSRGMSRNWVFWEPYVNLLILFWSAGLGIVQWTWEAKLVCTYN